MVIGGREMQRDSFVVRMFVCAGTKSLEICNPIVSDMMTQVLI